MNVLKEMPNSWGNENAKEELYELLLPEGEHKNGSIEEGSTPTYLEQHGSVEVVVDQGSVSLTPRIYPACCSPQLCFIFM